MAVENKIARNSAVLFTSTAISGMFIFVYQIVLARYLGANDFGLYSFAFAYVALFSFFLEGGLGTLIVREVARNRELAANYLVGSLFNKIWLFIIVGTIASICVSYLGKEKAATDLIYLFILAAFFENFANSFINIFKAYEEMIYPGVYQIVKNLLIMIVALGGSYLHLSVRWIVTYYTIACFLALLFSLFLYKRRFNLFAGLDIRFSMRMMISSLSFFASGALAMFYTRIDTVILSFFRSNVEVGLYNASYRLLDMLTIVPGVFLSAVFPSMAVAHLESPDTLRLIFKKVTQILVILILPICIGTTILSKEIITALYGNEYIPSAAALKILIWSAFFMFLSAPCGNLLNATNHQRKNVYFIAIVTAFNVILNIYLIRLHGYIGASYTMAISEILSFSLAYGLIYVYMFKIDIIKILIKPLMASIIMGAFIILIRELNLFLVISLSAGIYLLSLLTLKTFSKEDLSAVKKMIGRKHE